jgi:hypothetical protein
MLPAPTLIIATYRSVPSGGWIAPRQLADSGYPWRNSRIRESTNCGLSQCPRCPAFGMTAVRTGQDFPRIYVHHFLISNEKEHGNLDTLKLGVRHGPVNAELGGLRILCGHDKPVQPDSRGA